MSGAAIVLVALVLDLALGWPKWLYAAIGHPVTWIGTLIARLDAWLNLEASDEHGRRIAGIVAALVVIMVAANLAWILTWFLPSGWFGVLLGGILAWPFVALRSMHEHVAAVAAPLEAGNLDGARHAVSMIVGRDPSRLDEAGVARAAIESLAENTSDGIVAPVFWGVIFGLPGLAAYKAINTLDSMIGHRTPRHEAFGWASARIDDVVNLIPARLTGLLFAAVSTRPKEALATMRRDAGHHRSPNAGWPEAAMAGALGIRLSGPRVYADRVADEPWVNAGGADPGATDIGRALGLYRFAMLALAAVVALCALI
ncbi:adenosylcobinamide-phosphate synthase CbiB [Defluviimonas sp. WL0024]|uniref:Cobalamin biosynthesis protein CobD n=1 Tax=Albidovulum salinarum TaxID=2984153 RepID=A0ABT2X7S6_9RHOB|nr:adenosylcobinamide-phosphate synthase CbiB [Defluviimonas sp. WL0024]MCU9849414.1 adenosylcobinamide-phosphate synthase CbiB [Defluviimonas sp. WL0024]